MEQFIEIIQQLPIWVKAFVCVTIIPLYTYREPIGYVIKKIEPKFFFRPRGEPQDMADLLVHDFFISLSEICSKVEQVDFTHEGSLNDFKRSMMIKLISLKTECIDRSFKELLQHPQIGIVGSQRFKFLIIKGIQNLIKEYNEEAVSCFIEMGVSEIDAKYFVNSYEGYRETIISSFMDRLESITTSKQYPTNYERMLAMLEVLTLAVDVIPRDVKSLYVIINGRYDKYNMRVLK